MIAEHEQQYISNQHRDGDDARREHVRPLDADLRLAKLIVNVLVRLRVRSMRPFGSCGSRHEYPLDRCFSVGGPKSRRFPQDLSILFQTRDVFFGAVRQVERQVHSFYSERCPYILRLCPDLLARRQ